MDKPTTSKLDPRFLIERQGKQFALYAGLLDLAHQQGLKEITTELIQIGTDENGQTWLFKATVVTERGRFTGWADASPSNVSRQMLTCLPRMAETRSKARALRDATNVGVAALEELGGEDAPDEPTHPGARPTPAPTPIRPTPPSAAPAQPADPSPGGVNSADQATNAQIRAIYAIGRDQHGMKEANVDAKSRALYGAPPTELTRKQASEFITALKGDVGTR